MDPVRECLCRSGLRRTPAYFFDVDGTVIYCPRCKRVRVDGDTQDFDAGLDRAELDAALRERCILLTRADNERAHAERYRDLEFK